MTSRRTWSGQLDHGTQSFCIVDSPGTAAPSAMEASILLDPQLAYALARLVPQCARPVPSRVLQSVLLAHMVSSLGELLPLQKS